MKEVPAVLGARLRNPTACERCRTSKTRCLAFKQSGVCQRCFKTRSNCVYRPVKHSISTSSLSGRTQENYTGHEAPDFHLNLPSVGYPDISEAVTMMKRNHSRAFDQLLPLDKPERHQSRIGSSAQILESRGVSTSKETSCPYNPPIIEQKTLNIDKARQLLSSFCDFTTFFPFVPGLESNSIQSMAKDHPFVLLAMLTAASATDIELHHQLDHELRQVLSLKVVAEGQRSLDFLQGLLIYIAWYPSCLKVSHHESYMFMNLAISIAMDLGLDRPREKDDTLFSQNHICNTDLFSGISFSTAAQRAYLGCYYLSSSIAEVFSKPNPLKFDATIEQYGNRIAAAPEYLSDLSLLPLVKSQEICERVREALRPQLSAKAPLKSMPFNAQVNGCVFQRELDEWTFSLKEEVASTTIIALMEQYFVVAIYCHGLMMVRPNRMQQEWLVSGSGYLSVPDLTRCLQAAKEFFEILLSIPASQIKYFTCAVWGRVVEVFVVLWRLSYPIPANSEWDYQATRRYAPLVMYLDCLCYKLQGLSNTTAKDTDLCGHPDTPYLYKIVLETLKDSHERRIECEANSATAGGANSKSSRRSGSHCPMMNRSITSYIDTWQAPSHDTMLVLDVENSLETSNTKTIKPVYHDIWATMTMSWASE